MPRILHAANLHISVSEKEYSLAVLDEIVATAVNTKADALVFAGDLFDSFSDCETTGLISVLISCPSRDVVDFCFFLVTTRILGEDPEHYPVRISELPRSWRGNPLGCTASTTLKYSLSLTRRATQDTEHGRFPRRRRSSASLWRMLWLRVRHSLLTTSRKTPASWIPTYSLVARSITQPWATSTLRGSSRGQHVGV
jgi:hypothetical protein